MASCEICNDGVVMTKHGLKIHLGKVHDVHSSERIGDYVGNGHVEVEPNTQAERPDLISCPHPFCKVRLSQSELRGHWDSDHPTWLMHDGRYVWEV
jgi:hypothetical protein